jgi:hypothetical protein
MPPVTLTENAFEPNSIFFVFKVDKNLVVFFWMYHNVTSSLGELK